MNGSGAIGKVGPPVAPADIGGMLMRGPRSGMGMGMGKPAAPKPGAPPTALNPGRPPATPGKFMKLKSGIVGAGSCIPGGATKALPVVVDIIKGMEKGTAPVEGGMEKGTWPVEGRTGIVGAPDINGEGSTGAFGS